MTHTAIIKLGSRFITLRHLHTLGVQITSCTLTNPIYFLTFRKSQKLDGNSAQTVRVWRKWDTKQMARAEDGNLRAGTLVNRPSRTV